MKAFKLLTICFVVCSLFVGNLFAVCFVGVNPNIAGAWNDPGGPAALVAQEGDTIYYFVSISIPLSNCPHMDISGSVTLPNGTNVPLPAIPDMLPGESYDFLGLPVATYVMSAADLGQRTDNPSGSDPTQADEVRTVVNILGTAVTSGTLENPITTQGAAGVSTYDTKLVIGCVEVTKTPDCDCDHHLRQCVLHHPNYKLRRHRSGICFNYRCAVSGIVGGCFLPDTGPGRIL